MATVAGPVLPMRTAHEWASINPMLSRGTLVYESDTHAMKVGDGIHRYADLPYAGVVASTGE